jgi:predicted DNA-binding WGR domain protein
LHRVPRPSQLDLALMTQTNTSSGTERPLRRVEGGVVCAAPTGGGAKAKAAAKPRALSAAAATKAARLQLIATNLFGANGDSDSESDESDDPPPAAKAKAAPKAAAGAAAAAARSAAPLGARPLDAPMHALLAGGSVHEDWDAALMQTNLDANANKFLRQQIVRMPNGTFYVHRRWGRVGYAGEIKKTPDGPFACSAQAEREFEK